MWCEVCGIDCNSQDVFGKHIQGKKHQKKLRAQINSHNSMLLETSHGNLGGQLCNTCGHIIPGAASEGLEMKKEMVLRGGGLVSEGLEMKKEMVLRGGGLVSEGLEMKREMVLTGGGVLSEGLEMKQEMAVTGSGAVADSAMILSGGSVVSEGLEMKKEMVLTGGSMSSEGLEINKEMVLTSGGMVNEGLEMKKEMVLSGGGVLSEGLEMKQEMVLTGGGLVADSAMVLSGSCVIADSKMACTICNITCNNQEAFNKHLSGKKHAAQVRLISSNGIGPYLAAFRAHGIGPWEKVPKKAKVVQSALCEICNVICDNHDVLVKHLSGKKHQKNLNKLSASTSVDASSISITAANAPEPATNPVIELGENQDVIKGKEPDLGNSIKKRVLSESTTEVLEAKRRKVVESGTAAAAIRSCTLCNVVCNSDTAFNSHIAGRKHAALLKKQAESGMAATTGLITAT